MINVLIVDDHPVFRRGLRGVLEEADDILVVGEADCGDDGVALAQSLRPDVVLMDLHMTGTDGIGATAVLTAHDPDIAVLVLTMASDDDSVHAALRAGAQGYLVKGASGERIVAAVRVAAAGELVLGADIVPALVRRLTGPQTRARRGPFPNLTEREEEVLDYVARGWSNAEVARHLHVSEKTVRNYVSTLFAKLGVPDRARAIVLAREAGLGDRPPEAGAACSPEPP